MSADKMQPTVSLDTLPMDEVRQMVIGNADRVAAEWPDWKKAHAANSLGSRIPKGEDVAPGFDAGIACALDMIPRDKQALGAALHGDYTPARVDQARKESEAMDPNSETAWWLAACYVCQENSQVDEGGLREQLRRFEEVAKDDNMRQQLAREELAEMTSTFETDTYGVPFGTVDGCMQGAYLKGYPFATQYADQHDMYFVGTYHESLGLEDFPWEDPDTTDAEGKLQLGKSGPVHGSKQFVKCANEAEFRRVIEAVNKNFQPPARESVQAALAADEQVETPATRYELQKNMTFTIPVEGLSD